MSNAIHKDMYYTVDQTTKLLKCGRVSLYKLMNTGQLASVKKGGRRLIHGAAILTFIRIAEETCNG